ncbi:MAG TPA: vWA domain-containing protein [Polyangiaceae bacterium]
MKIARLAARFISVSSVLALVAAVGCGGSDNGDSNFDAGAGGGGGGDTDGGGGGGGLGDGGGGFTGTDGGALGEDGGLAACATAEATATKTPVYMMVILDGSGSMDNDPKENDPLKAGSQRGTKWLAVRGALHAFWDGLVSKPDNSLGVGLYLFSSSTTKSATAIDVGIKAVDAAQATALEARVDPNIKPTGGTPLQASYEGQLTLLKSFTPSAPLVSGGKLVMVVMTDGVPDGGGTAQNAIVADATAAFSGTPKVTTFAVGVGDPNASTGDYDEVFMGKLAVAGGAPAAGCTPGWNQSSPAGQIPCHFQITPSAKTAAMIQAEFLAAIDNIRDQVSSCTFTLDKSGGAIDPSKVNVVYTSGAGVSTTVPQDPTNGWSYDNPTDPSTVTLNGTSCNTVKSDSDGTVKIVLGCATQAPK